MAGTPSFSSATSIPTTGRCTFSERQHRDPHGEIVCLLGGNASGKTTTLKAVLGMVIPSAGDILLDGEVVTNCSTSVRVPAVAYRWFGRTAGCSSA